MYRSPIVRMRQMFDLYICLRPCKAYTGNPLNFKEGIDLVIFRENTEDLYAGVEFNPVPEGADRRALADSRDRSVRSRICPVMHTRSPARSIRRRGRSGSYVRRSSSPGNTIGRRSPLSTRPMWSAQPTVSSSKRHARWRANIPEIQCDDANVDAICMWLLKNPFNYDVLVAPNLYGDIISDLAAQMVGGLGFRMLGQYRRIDLPSSSHPTVRRRNMPDSTR